MGEKKPQKKKKKKKKLKNWEQLAWGNSGEWAKRSTSKTYSISY